MAGATAQKRCLRCGTIIRNRPVCPCCGCEEHGIVERRAGVTQAAGGATGARRPAKSGSTMCPVCLGSAPSDSLADFNGQMVCAVCHKTMSGAKESGPGGGMQAVLGAMLPEIAIVQQDFASALIAILPAHWNAVEVEISAGLLGLSAKISSPEGHTEAVQMPQVLSMKLKRLQAERKGDWKKLILQGNKEPGGDWTFAVTPV